MDNPLYPRYVSPKERAETRARIRAFVIWSVATIVVFVLLMMFAYTDQAPRWMQELAFKIDREFGFPVLALIQAIAT